MHPGAFGSRRNLLVPSVRFNVRKWQTFYNHKIGNGCTVRKMKTIAIFSLILKFFSRLFNNISILFTFQHFFPIHPRARSRHLWWTHQQQWPALPCFLNLFVLQLMRGHFLSSSLRISKVVLWVGGGLVGGPLNRLAQHGLLKENYLRLLLTLATGGSQRSFHFLVGS